MCRTGTHEKGFAPGGEREETDDVLVLEVDRPGIASIDPELNAASSLAETTSARRDRVDTELSRVVTGTAGPAVPCATHGAALTDLLLFLAHSEVGS